MTQAMLQDTINTMAVPGKGILAADESNPTIAKRFTSINVDNTENNRRDYREGLFRTEDLGQYINGVILFEETLTQQAADGTPLVELLNRQGIISGIKVDKGLIDLAFASAEKVTQGLDGLAQRLPSYIDQGARFTKWRAVYRISESTPSEQAIVSQAEGLARYAAICQANGLVPIVEPEVLMEGNHDLNRSRDAHESVLSEVFNALRRHHVQLETIILKPSMVISGSDASQRASIEEVGEATVEVLRRTVPAAVPTINFLSGGQTDEEATAHLNAMNALPGAKPWILSFSYGRALQAAALKAWSGKTENIPAMQQALFKRAMLNAAATKGEYNANMEN